MWIVAALVTMISFGTNNSIFKWSTVNGFSKVHIRIIFTKIQRKNAVVQIGYCIFLKIRKHKSLNLENCPAQAP
jgi:hypothetical protein